MVTETSVLEKSFGFGAFSMQTDERQLYRKSVILSLSQKADNENPQAFFSPLHCVQRYMCVYVALYLSKSCVYGCSSTELKHQR